MSKEFFGQFGKGFSKPEKGDLVISFLRAAPALPGLGLLNELFQAEPSLPQVVQWGSICAGTAIGCAIAPFVKIPEVAKATKFAQAVIPVIAMQFGLLVGYFASDSIRVDAINDGRDREVVILNSVEKLDPAALTTGGITNKQAFCKDSDIGKTLVTVGQGYSQKMYSLDCGY